MSFSEWIILRTGGQTWYNYFIPPTSVKTLNRAKVGKGGIIPSMHSLPEGPIRHCHC